MARYDYMFSLEIFRTRPTFKAVIMAAMRQADSVNIEKLKASWPDVWEELQGRYNAPGGWLPGEINDDGEVVNG